MIDLRLGNCMDPTAGLPAHDDRLETIRSSVVRVC